MEFLQSIISHLPSSAELVSAIPVIISLIIIEGLLSVDNAMAIAAMASQLPKHQQKLALKLGIIGAYVFRGICLFFVAYIAGNQWLKVLGAAYLLYLMCQHLISDEEDANQDGVADGLQRGLLATIIQIEIMDLSLSLDNVVAAVALDKRLWVICTGVFIGILALRFVAGACIRMIDKYPILKQTAFLLVGFVGAILLTELALEWMNVHFHINSYQKFVGIVVIVASSLWYDNTPAGRKWLGPLVKGGKPVLIALNGILGILLTPITWPFNFAKRMWAKRKQVAA